MSRIEKIKEFLKGSPADSFLQHALALEYVKEGNDQAAMELFQSLLAREPSYVGSYYHLAALHVRSNNVEEAICVYEKGMEEAKKAGDDHAFSELQRAFEDITQ